ncbi:FeoB-associated Cys-rich membrane protein [Mailhella sp.]|uniref:FeoB-associated Cys-rich membrane protein n=1 Tax=Mailhella sp. TaxID=1981029 RepID=UPI003AB85F33
MQTTIVIVILALAGAYLIRRFRRSLSGGGCSCGCSRSGKGGCAGCGGATLKPYRDPRGDGASGRS